MTSVKIEFFYAQGCKRCAAARDELRNIALSMPGLSVAWEEVDVAKEPERAVALGVFSTPALAINRELVFKAAPKPDELRANLDVRSRR